MVNIATILRGVQKNQQTEADNKVIRNKDKINERIKVEQSQQLMYGDQMIAQKTRRLRKTNVINKLNLRVGKILTKLGLKDQDLMFQGKIRMKENNM